jgi:hypothetical protein
MEERLVETVTAFVSDEFAWLTMLVEISVMIGT